MKKILITGSAGFIGFSLARRALNEGFDVLGMDALTDFYGLHLKKARNKILLSYENYRFKNIALENKEQLKSLLQSFEADVILHFAAQAGVRYSIEQPQIYLDSNLIGSFNLLDCLKEQKCEHLLIASTSSVYGKTSEFPFKETLPANNQVSFYAATKKSVEILAHSYAHIFDIPTTCLRFFTVYGPWGRPDMALFKFTDLILKGEPIEVYNKGEMIRDFTYIEDLVESIFRLLDKIPKHGNKAHYKHDNISKDAPFRLVNIGGKKPRKVSEMINILEDTLQMKVKVNYESSPLGDVPITHADTSLLKEMINFVPETSLEVGIKKFVNWFQTDYLEVVKNGGRSF